jgi:DNA repair exonuclease SbcCD ATPase subunit
MLITQMLSDATRQCIVIPNAIFVPEKYHPFIDSSVRRIYLDNSAELALQEQVKQLEARVKSLETQKDQLMDRCESYMQASLRHAENEKDVRTRCTALKKELKQANQSVAELTDREARRCVYILAHLIYMSLIYFSKGGP